MNNIYNYLCNFADFYALMGGMIILQMIGHWLACKAQDHNLLSDIMVRVMFAIIQTVLCLITDNRFHFFQYKLLMVQILNSILFLMSVEMNPLFTLPLLIFLTNPYWRRCEKLLEKEIEEACRSDTNMAFLYPND